MFIALNLEVSGVFQITSFMLTVIAKESCRTTTCEVSVDIL